MAPWPTVVDRNAEEPQAWWTIAMGRTPSRTSLDPQPLALQSASADPAPAVGDGGGDRPANLRVIYTPGFGMIAEPDSRSRMVLNHYEKITP